MGNHTQEEANLLLRLSSGALDGMVGDERAYGTYKHVYCGKIIKNGEPIAYRRGEAERFFNGKETEKIPGRLEEEHFDTEDRKLEFLQRYGWLMDDAEVRAYSAKFKPKR